MANVVTTVVRLLLLVIGVPAGIACARSAQDGDAENAVLLGVVCALCLLGQVGYARLSRPY